MFERVLIALDGSKRSERAIDWAARVAPGAQVTLVNVIEVADPLTLYPDYLSDLRLTTEKYLRGLSGRFEKGEVRILQGSAVDQILQAVHEVRPDLVAITTHGGRAATRRVLGGTAERLMHQVSVPLLVVPSWQESAVPERLHVIAVPLDGSTASESVLPVARHLAKENEARVLLVHGLTELDDAERAFSDLEGHARRHPMMREIEAALNRYREQVQNRFDRIVTELGRDGIATRTNFTRGRIPESLVTAAENEHAELVVMAAHGYGAVKRALLGSVASRLIREASFPVLVARRAGA